MQRHPTELTPLDRHTQPQPQRAGGQLHHLVLIVRDVLGQAAGENDANQLKKRKKKTNPTHQRQPKPGRGVLGDKLLQSISFYKIQRSTVGFINQNMGCCALLWSNREGLKWSILAGICQTSSAQERLHVPSCYVLLREASTVLW